MTRLFAERILHVMLPRNFDDLASSEGRFSQKE